MSFFLCRFDKVYDSLYNICIAEDSIRPEKYTVDGHPPMNGFPANHPNRGLQLNTDPIPIPILIKDEL